MINQLSDEYVLLAEITMLLSLAVWLCALTNRILQAIKPFQIESFGLNANQRAVVLQNKKKYSPQNLNHQKSIRFGFIVGN